MQQILQSQFGISKEIYNACMSAQSKVAHTFSEIDNTAQHNQMKVLAAFQKNRISETHFVKTTGYGYDDAGREALDAVFADIFGAEDALVRHNIVSGTHAIATCLYAVLRPGDTLVSLTGKPYDTLEEVIGIRGGGNGSLADFGVGYRQVDLKKSGNVDFEQIEASIDCSVKAVLIQRSKGYDWRASLTVEQIGELIKFVKSIKSDIICIVDNCYGEFVQTIEPPQVGADLTVGSLIKNPGGGIAFTGGYIVGKREYVQQAACRLTAPGIGKKCGATLDFNRSMFQGVFMAPLIVSQALRGAVLCGVAFENMGFEVAPTTDEARSCIIQAIKFGDPKLVIAFCQGIQKAAPIDSFVAPEPWDMPGYASQVIMAAGAFVQGASIELSADAPIKEPYIAYMQGGLTYAHCQVGVMCALKEVIAAMDKKGLV